MAKKFTFPEPKAPMPPRADLVPPLAPAPAEIPATSDASPSAPQQKRRTTHGIVCRCGSADVEITKTQNLGSQYPAFMNRPSKTVRRYCHCKVCNANWTSVAEITERKIK